jgi:hypothetical protein
VGSHLRAGAGAKLRVGSRMEPIDGRELEDGEDKVAIMLAISRQYPFFARAFQGRPEAGDARTGPRGAAQYPPVQDRCGRR